MTYEKKLTLCTAKVAVAATAVACLAAIFVVNIILGSVFPSYGYKGFVALISLVGNGGLFVFMAIELCNAVKMKASLVKNKEQGIPSFDTYTTCFKNTTGGCAFVLVLMLAFIIFRLVTIFGGAYVIYDGAIFLIVFIYMAIELSQVESKRKLFVEKTTTKRAKVGFGLCYERSMASNIILMMAGVGYVCAFAFLVFMNSKRLSPTNGQLAEFVFFLGLMMIGVVVLLYATTKLAITVIEKNEATKSDFNVQDLRVIKTVNTPQETPEAQAE